MKEKRYMTFEDWYSGRSEVNDVRHFSADPKDWFAICWEESRKQAFRDVSEFAERFDSASAYEIRQWLSRNGDC